MALVVDNSIEQKKGFQGFHKENRNKGLNSFCESCDLFLIFSIPSVGLVELKLVFRRGFIPLGFLSYLLIVICLIYFSYGLCLYFF